MPFSNSNKTPTKIKTNSTNDLVIDPNISQIKANLWPYPKQITQGTHYFEFSHRSLFNNSNFNIYKQSLVLGLSNPLNELNPD